MKQPRLWVWVVLKKGKDRIYRTVMASTMELGALPGEVVVRVGVPVPKKRVTP